MPSSRSRSTGQTRGTRAPADATYRAVALSCWPFEPLALPMGCVGRGCVGAVQKRLECLLWIACRSNHLVRQHEFAELLVPACLGWLNRVVGVSLWCWVGVAVEDALFGAVWPVPATAHLVRVRLKHDPRSDVGDAAGVWRSDAAGEAGRGQVKRPPEQMHRTRLPGEAAAELFEHRHHPRERQPEALRLVGVV